MTWWPIRSFYIRSCLFGTPLVVRSCMRLRRYRQYPRNSAEFQTSFTTRRGAQKWGNIWRREPSNPPIIGILSVGIESGCSPKTQNKRHWTISVDICSPPPYTALDPPTPVLFTIYVDPPLISLDTEPPSPPYEALAVRVMAGVVNSAAAPTRPRNGLVAPSSGNPSTFTYVACEG